LTPATPQYFKIFLDLSGALSGGATGFGVDVLAGDFAGDFAGVDDSGLQAVVISWTPMVE